MSGCEYQNSSMESKKEIVIGRYNDSISLDPANATDNESFQVTVNIFETLVVADEKGLDIEPGLAESWEIGENGLSVKFKLRKDVLFHDGTHLDAEAVVFNFKRWMEEDNPYHVGKFSYWNQSFVGERNFVVSVDAVSKYEVQLTLSEPYTPLLSALSMPAFGIASPSAIKKYNENMGTTPVGTGPYSLEAWVKGEKIVLKRFDDYWQGVPKISKVVFKQMDIIDDNVELLEAGKIHMLTQLSPMHIDALEKSKNIEIHYSPFINVSYLALNNSIEPFSDYNVRRAVEKLIDYDKMMETAFNEFARPAATFLPPTILGYHEGIRLEDYDLEGALSLLKEAGYEDGLNIQLYVMEQPRVYYQDPLKVAEYIKNQLAMAGIDVEIISFPWNEYLNVVDQGSHNMALVGWEGDFADPDNFLYTMFFSENTGRGTVMNYSFYSNDIVDYFLKQGRILQNSEFRESIYRNILEILNDQAASIPLTHTVSVMGINRQVRGFVYDITGYIKVFGMDIVQDKKDMDFSSLSRPIANEMLMITSAGQNTDSYILKDIADRERIHHYFMPDAEFVVAESTKSLAVVVGYSDINMKIKATSHVKELERIDKLLDDIAKGDLSLITIVISENAVKNNESEEMLDKLVPSSDYVIMVSGDYNDRYIDITSSLDIPITIVETPDELDEAFVSAFR
jgi:peptide/nickel transport system substrate-binding protein